ncbi:hypothetical protein L798_12312 [Zootermopsis nevadensis]|uniref:Uncharacterized protein n=1 Tax=Zootermopsis nevadensis TaxID=136037 RepID=A0A067QX18_ZOONE|nr:hypothetical protein L798_12312 [Zootermopsis nevadensis]
MQAPSDGKRTHTRGSRTKHFHNLKVSSAPADNTVLPSGHRASCKTRFLWPVNSATWN